MECAYEITIVDLNVAFAKILACLLRLAGRSISTYLRLFLAANGIFYLGFLVEKYFHFEKLT